MIEAAVILSGCCGTGLISASSWTTGTSCRLDVGWSAGVTVHGAAFALPRAGPE